MFIFIVGGARGTLLLDSVWVLIFEILRVRLIMAAAAAGLSGPVGMIRVRLDGAQRPFGALSVADPVACTLAELRAQIEV